jgi:pimeloyl-ACP methyl ester carboxylesterase
MFRLARRAVAVSALIVAGLAPAARASQVPPPERFTVVADGHPLAVWARLPASPRAAAVLVHGRTWSSLPDFDLQVPGRERSVMAALAARGIAAYAVDMRGYGQTPRDESGWLTPRRSAADVLAVLDWVATRHPQLAPPAVIGWSRGAAIAQLAVQAAPTSTSALVLFGFVFDPDLRFVDLALPDEPARAPNTEASARSDFISPAVTPPEVVEAFVEQALAADPVLADLRGDGQFDALDPTLVIFGQRDPGIYEDAAAKFFARLATPDRSMVVLPGADHAAQLEDTHEAWISAVAEFLLRPRQ